MGFRSFVTRVIIHHIGVMALEEFPLDSVVVEAHGCRGDGCHDPGAVCKPAFIFA